MNVLAERQKCVLMKNGVQIWLSEKKALELQNLLETITHSKIITISGIDNQSINTAEINGIYTPETIADFNRQKSGEWKCGSNNWHTRGERCNCATKEQKEFLELRQKATQSCKRGCEEGWIVKNNTAKMCECISGYYKNE